MQFARRGTEVCLQGTGEEESLLPFYKVLSKTKQTNQPQPIEKFLTSHCKYKETICKFVHIYGELLSM